MIKRLIPGVVVCAAVLSVTCSQAWAQDKIIAVVNNEVVTQKDLDSFKSFVRLQLSQGFEGDELEQKVEEAGQNMLNKLIEDKLILQEAEKLAVGVDDSRIKARINDIKKRFNSEVEFQNDLMRQGLVQADLERKVREQIMMYTVVDQEIRQKVVVKPDEVTAFYQGHLKELTTDETRELEAVALENEDQAKSFAYNYKIGQSLVDLATRYPLTVNKISVARGQGQVKPEIEETIFALQTGDVSDPLTIDGTFYVFKLENIIPAKQLSLCEAQSRVYAYLFERKMQENLTEWLDDLKTKSYIKIM